MRVLIADDDADIRELLVESFRGAGFDVLQAANGLEALLCVKRDRPDAVVLDLMMPRLGGVAALKRIHAFNPGIRALVVTGALDAELHRQATLAGAAGVFAKPVSPATLVAALAGPAPAPPLQPAPPAPSAPAAASGAPTSRVLVVDDNTEVRAMLEDVLTSLGYSTRTAADGATAVRAVLSEAPDVVLLDVYMPGLSGVGALPTIVALAPNAKVIMISGAANEDVLKRSLAFGAHDYVTKPFEISSLSRALETALAMRRLESGPGTSGG
ncbi:MAG TPA: response regulator [Methylomirabilota bacterium]|nr:response regulator [Methylomirabilota bacterium]